MTLNTCTVLLNEIRNMEWNEVEWNGLAGTVPFHYFWKTLSQESLFHPPPPPRALREQICLVTKSTVKDSGSQL